MRLNEFASNDKKLNSILETASAASTSAASIASVPMAGSNIVRRIPTEPNFFGFIPAEPQKTKKSKKKRKK